MVVVRRCGISAQLVSIGRQAFIGAINVQRTVRNRGIRTGISEARKRVPIFPFLPREASKRVPIFDRGTGSKPARPRSGFLQADLSLIV